MRSEALAATLDAGDLAIVLEALVEFNVTVQRRRYVAPNGDDVQRLIRNLTFQQTHGVDRDFLVDQVEALEPASWPIEGGAR